MNALNNKQIAVYTAVGKATKKSAREEFKLAYAAAVKTLAVQAGLGFISEDTKTYMRTANHAMKMGLKKGVYVKSLQDVALLKKVVRTGKWLGWGAMIIGILTDVRDVVITYKEGGNWQKDVRNIITEYVVGRAVG